MESSYREEAKVRVQDQKMASNADIDMSFSRASMPDTVMASDYRLANRSGLPSGQEKD